MCSWIRQLTTIFMFLFFLPVMAYSGGLFPETHHILIENIRAHDVTILGERHRQPESTELLVELADTLSADGHCLAVGLEFDTDQNPTLDAFLAGKESVEAIAVPQIIDHPGFRDMLVELRKLVRAGHCLGVQGVDLPRRLWSGEKNRDEWMADQLATMMGDRPVLALLGNAHGIRAVRWESGLNRPHAAELLILKGSDVFSVMQDWPGQVTGTRPVGRWYPDDHQAAHKVFANLLRVKSVVVPEDLSVIGDGVVVW
ncbi:ChaN family lipoprotein [Desulfurivibrio sp. C05AmB]|uniref:ChaN family lipoprotein n=1 Tax=Desulfurivibrio sp. C05AmB TaxID=3374371 RepID=UPI00376F0D86